MTQEEKNVIATLPAAYRPLGAWSYIGYSILFNIPVVGWIFMIIFSFKNSNINRRSFARAFLIPYIAAAIIGVIYAIIAIIIVIIAGNAIIR